MLIPLPKTIKLRKGDEVLIRASIKFDPETDEDVHLSVVGATWATLSVPAKEVFGLYCRAWESGDKIQETRAPNSKGEVIAVAEDCVWVKLKSGDFQTFAANDLEEQPDPGIIDEPRRE